MKTLDSSVRALTALAVLLGLAIAVNRYMSVSAQAAWAMSERFFGLSAPLFGIAAAFLIWVLGALLAEAFGLTVTAAQVVEVGLCGPPTDGDLKVVRTEGGDEYRAPAVIIATMLMKSVTHFVETK